MARPGILFGIVALAALALASRDPAPRPAAAAATMTREQGCATCHTGIEVMHPKAELSCTDCHGGDADATSKDAAHVKPKRTEAGDERVAGRDEDLPWRRFRNPMDLRVARETCGGCHAEEVTRVHSSLHATTAGHLSDGFYEVGLLKEKGSKYAVFPTTGDPANPGEVASLEQAPTFSERLPREKLSTQFLDLTRKECAQCHLWSNGRGVRGRVGFDGDYRGEGCAACHVSYAHDGRSQSADNQIQHNEPGHPSHHAMTRAPTTQTCTSCHNGDASIGLSFQGLSQLPPGAPGGPEIPGTTDALSHRAFFIDDPGTTPPDVHHERGMHCIDCHTENDAMGDGRLHGAMEKAVEISCQDCHGGFTAPATLETARGTKLRHVTREADGVWLTSKVDGSRHRVVQVVDVLAHGSNDYNERATKAMTASHAKLECYTCHASWNVNFLGFHFDRNESLTQLDLLSGKRTPGRVTTQEKIFVTWKSFFAGFNESGRVAPYLTGFSTMGTLHDKNGDVVLDQELPATAAGLSGMTMIHHQVHTTRPTARSCVECHRSSATWGMGSSNFRLSRRLAFVADRRGIEVVALDRSQIQSSVPLCKVVVPNVVALAVDSDPLQGHARFVYASEEGHGVHVIDVSNPTAPVRVGFAACVSPQGLALCGHFLLCADGAGGLKVFDVSTPAKIHLAGGLSTLDAKAIDLQWPYAYIADAAGGLLIVDVKSPAKLVAVGGLAIDYKGRPDDSLSVAVLFQYSRPSVFEGRPADDRTTARALCAVLDGKRGLELVDVTEPTAPEKLWPQRWVEDMPKNQRRRDSTQWRGLVLQSQVKLAQAQGGSQTSERDVVYAMNQRDENGNARSRIAVYDVTDPLSTAALGETPLGFDTHGLAVASIYQPPFLSTVAFVPGDRGISTADLSISVEPRELGVFSGLSDARALAFEEFAMDRSIDEQGTRLKDVSHRDSRWLDLPEIARVLGVPAEGLSFQARVAESVIPASTARLHLEKLDLDHSMFLEGAEYKAAGGLEADGNADGRISLAELVALAKKDEDGGDTDVKDEPMPERPMRPKAGKREQPKSHDPDGELACLLDTVRPREFDADTDERLDAAEFARAVFAALDLDRDKQVSLSELSRLVGETRELRFGGARATELAKSYDKNGDGQVSPKEWRSAAEIFQILDLDKDGAIQLPQHVDVVKGKQATDRPSEWPTRQPVVNSLPPVISREKLMALFDSDHDDVLTAKELKSRPDLLSEGDDTGDGRIEHMELQADLDRVGGDGVEVTLDGFLERWDLDRNGTVTHDELPLWVRK
ncbi:MAG TPA: hypothetical protein VK843_19345 [Planctomycetota bacterium]|nr:hypothetical protein [Planctomycetota bacterium]